MKKLSTPHTVLAALVWLALLAPLSIALADEPEAQPEQPKPECAPVVQSEEPTDEELKAFLPEWIQKGSGVYEVDGKRVVRGVGVATSHGGPLLRVMQQATEQARVEIGRILNEIIVSHAVSVTNSQGQVQKIAYTRRIVQAQLTGAEITAQFYNRRTKNYYVLVEMELPRGE